jgi:cysteinyl-tRNA synthetase
VNYKNNFKGNTKGIKIFVCGPTVYNYCHLGHSRVFIFYDLVARYLRFIGFKPNIIINITDIDPKISIEATQEGISDHDLSNKFISELYLDASALRLDGITFARASDYVEVSKVLISRLVKKKAAYSANGNIYLDTAKIPSYGQLSSLTREELAQVRLDIAPKKHNPSDILLWNTSDYTGQSYDDKTFGSGFPSSPVQDTSILLSNFGRSYHIHGGAIDLLYPHHESILGQLRILSSLKSPVTYWTHVGLVYSQGKKMSNSLGNTFTIREVLEQYNYNILRLYIFSEHYRSPLKFSQSRLNEFEILDRRIAAMMAANNIAESKLYSRVESKIMRKFRIFIEDDFDTVNALRILNSIVEDGNAFADVRKMINILGLHY